MKVRIDQPIDVVFDFLGRATNEGTFNPAIRLVAPLPEPDSSAGVSYLRLQEAWGRKAVTSLEITEFTRPSRIAWMERRLDRTEIATGCYELHPVPEGTRLRVSRTSKFHAPRVLAYPLRWWGLRSRADRVRHVLESRAAAIPMDAFRGGFPSEG